MILKNVPLDVPHQDPPRHLGTKQHVSPRNYFYHRNDDIRRGHNDDFFIHGSTFFNDVAYIRLLRHLELPVSEHAANGWLLVEFVQRYVLSLVHRFLSDTDILYPYVYRQTLQRAEEQNRQLGV